MWPLLCCIHIEPQVVFPLALTYGRSKPTDLNFLRDSINELNHVVENGIQVHDVHVACKLRAVICDAPAKAFAKCIKQFNGNYGCDHCELKGERLDGKKRQLFLQTEDLPLRTNESFRRQLQEAHHKAMTPFLDLDLDMISGFPLDYMHLVCLGVMRKLLFAWVKGDRAVRISQQQIQQVSDALVSLQPFVPDCFARKPRSLTDLE